MYKNYIKRAIDMVLAFIGGIVLLPVFLIVSVAIYIDDPGPVLFKQNRIGKHKEIFVLHKFRSMKLKTPDIPTHLLTDPDQYITRVGKIIRKFSLDELPQIYDILIGKMSIIGPRPALWNQDDLIEERDKYGANDVRPGLTGLAQVNGRDKVSIEEKVRLDSEYVNTRNLILDIKIFLKTFVNVFKMSDVVEGGHE